MTVLETETGYAARLANALAFSGSRPQAKRGGQAVRCNALLGRSLCGRQLSDGYGPFDRPAKQCAEACE